VSITTHGQSGHPRRGARRAELAVRIKAINRESRLVRGTFDAKLCRYLASGSFVGSPINLTLLVISAKHNSSRSLSGKEMAEMAFFKREKSVWPNATTKPVSSPPNILTAPLPADDKRMTRLPEPVRAVVEPSNRLAKGCKVSGKLSFAGPALIDGEVDGDVTANGSVTIGESALVTALIRAASITVAGKVAADLTASQRIEIQSSAKVHGNLTSPVLVIHEGAVVNGDLAIRRQDIHDGRKVTVFPGSVPQN
jgi:cytoskeletal protein CcmA (bactofilin family)